MNKKGILVFYDTYYINGKPYKAYVIPLTNTLKIKSKESSFYTGGSPRGLRRLETVVFLDDTNKLVIEPDAIEKLYIIHYVNVNLLEPESKFDKSINSNKNSFDDYKMKINAVMDIMEEYEKVTKWYETSKSLGGIFVNPSNVPKKVVEIATDKFIEYLKNPEMFFYTLGKHDIIDAKNEFEQIEKELRSKNTKEYQNIQGYHERFFKAKNLYLNGSENSACLLTF